MPTPQPGRHGRRSVSAALLLAALSLVAAACGQDADAQDRSVASLPEAADTDANDGDGDGDGDGSDGAGTSGDGDELSEEEAFLAYEQCMSDKGIDTSPFSLDGAGEAIEGEADQDEAQGLTFDSEEDFEAFQAAEEECGAVLDDVFGDFELTPEQEAVQRDAELEFNQCMADQGFPIDVTGSGGGGGNGAIVQFEIDDDVDQEEINAAFAECEAVLNDALGDIYGDLGEADES